MVLEPMFWLLFEVQAMVAIGEWSSTLDWLRALFWRWMAAEEAGVRVLLLVWWRLQDAPMARAAQRCPRPSMSPLQARCRHHPVLPRAVLAAMPVSFFLAGPLALLPAGGVDMADPHVAMAAKAQAVDAQVAIDAFKSCLNHGWSLWRTRLAAAATTAGAATAAQQRRQQPGRSGISNCSHQQPPQQPQLVADDSGELLLLGRYADADAWLVQDVLPGLLRHPHLAGLHGLLSKWASKKLHDVSSPGSGVGWGGAGAGGRRRAVQQRVCVRGWP